MSDDVVLIGHRGAGKSTIAARLAAELGWEVVDIDRRIEEAEGASCAELLAADPERFRALEAQHLDEALAAGAGDDDDDDDTPRLLVPGAGCAHLPAGPLYLWLSRDGWEEAARDERARLRPELSFDAELRWMRETREPLWAKVAHLRVDLPRGRTVARAARQVATLIEWSRKARGSAFASKSWIVAGGPAQLDRALLDARRFGLAGVELRSDLFEAPPRLVDDDEVAIMASLRTPDPSWLEAMSHAAAFDVDVEHLPALLAAGTLDRLEARPLLLSSHPGHLDPTGVTDLFTHARRLQESFPAWADRLVLKYAPTVEGWTDIGAGLALLRPIVEKTTLGVTYLPRRPRGGRDLAWLRPLLLASFNATNYLPVGLAARRRGWGDFPNAPPWDLQDWLPHLAPPAPSCFDGLIGHPVDASQGDLWHRRAALASPHPELGYLKIPVHLDELDDALQLLATLPVRGLSVTSPLKEAVIASPLVDAPPTLSAANTLRATGIDGDTRWRTTDTDEIGMSAALSEIEGAGITPGTIALIGRGGVSPAIRRAIAASDWTLVCHASAREGWPHDRPERVTLVVNAAGNYNEPHHRAPRCDAWLDLHYANVRPAPEGALHFIGDGFFEAQAQAQRGDWVIG